MTAQAFAKQAVRLMVAPLAEIHFRRHPLQVEVESLMHTAKLLQSGKDSLIRFGDGEVKIIRGKDIPFQRYDKNLADGLSEILAEPESGNLHLALPDCFGGRKNLVFRARTFWLFHLFVSRSFWHSLPRRRWENAFFSRPYMDYANKDKADFFEEAKKIWSGREVLFIEGKSTRNGAGNDLFAGAAKITRVICPDRNAFSAAHDIAAFVERSTKKSTLILISLGPAAKIISFRLWKNGFTVIDIGHMDSEYEWFRLHASKKVPLAGKHAAEQEMREEPPDDAAWRSQVVADFSEGTP